MILQDSEFKTEAILAGIVAWAEIESPSTHAPGVNQLMDLAANDMRALGFTVTRQPGTDGYGDIVTARLNQHADTKSPGILVLCHLDTVHDVGTLAGPLPIHRDDDRLYGPGVLDMKGGVRLVIEALSALRHASVPPRLPVTVMFTPDEEVGSPSSRAAIEAEATRHAYVLVPEPLRPSGDVVTGRHAVQRFSVRIIGKPSHAGLTKSEGRSAIAKMAELITRVEALNTRTPGTTYAVGTVHGGIFVNVVARECRAQVLSVAPSDAALAEVHANMMALAGTTDGVTIEVEPGLTRPLAVPHAGTMALFATARAIAADIGITLTHCQSGGGSDGNFTGALAIPTLDGIGVAGRGAHTHEEHLLISSLQPRCRIIAGLLARLGA